MLPIRLAGPADAERLSLLGAATMLETYADKIGGEDLLAHCRNRHSAAVYAAWLADGRVTTWLVETATGAPAGYLVLTPATVPDTDPHPDDLEVQRIYVLGRFHGSGIGHGLMNRAIDAARAAGARQVVLGVLKTNARAVAFYKRQGFLEVGTRKFQVGQALFDDYVLGRRL